MTHFHQESFQVATRGRGTQEVTGQVAQIVSSSGVVTGLATVFVHHTAPR